MLMLRERTELGCSDAEPNGLAAGMFVGFGVGASVFVEAGSVGVEMGVSITG